MMMMTYTEYYQEKPGRRRRSRRTTLMVIILGCSLIERLREEMIIIIQKPFGQLLLHLVEGSVVVQVAGGWVCGLRIDGQELEAIYWGL